MRRVFRVIFTFASAVSLVLCVVLCVVVCVLWVRSYWSTDTWTWFSLDLDARRATEFRARSEHGLVRFSILTLMVAPGFYSNPADMKRLKDTEGLSHSSQRGVYGGRRLGQFPHWVLLPPLAILPVLWARRRRTDRHRTKGGLCLCCGYDVRASTERCPECGTPVPVQTK